MKKTIILAIAFICTIIAYYFFPFTEGHKQENLNSANVATFDGKRITTDDLLNNVPPLLYKLGAEKQVVQKIRLAHYIQALAFAQLADKFDVDLSNDAIIAFANRKFNNVFNPTEKQIKATEVYIHALREVVEERRSPRDVYDDYFKGKTFYDGKASLTFDEWKERVKNFGKQEIIAVLENDLSNKKKGISTEKASTYRWMYIEDALKNAYCDRNKVAAAIVKNLSSTVVTKDSKYAEPFIQQECKRIFYPWLLKQVTDKVKIIDNQYTGYEKYLSFYSMVQFLKRTSQSHVKGPDG